LLSGHSSPTAKIHDKEVDMASMSRIGASLALLTLAAPAFAASTKAEQPAAVGYSMPATATWDMTSDSGEVYRIFVSYPEKGEPPAGGYPVLYVLDGNAIFGGFAETRRLLAMMETPDIGKSIVVGVGYPTQDAYDMRRLYDFTGGPPPPPWDVDFKEQRSGGWDKFRDFLTGKLRTEIGQRYKINLQRQALFGHSPSTHCFHGPMPSMPSSPPALLCSGTRACWNRNATS
jgi:hypothetical protein